MWAGIIRAVVGAGRAAGAAMKSAGQQAAAAARTGVGAARAAGQAGARRAFTAARAGARRAAVTGRRSIRQAMQAMGFTPGRAGNSPSGASTSNGARPSSFNWGQVATQFTGGGFNPQQTAKMPSVSDAVGSLAKLAVSATGLTDGLNAMQKLLAGDVTGAMKDYLKALIKATTIFVGLPLAIRRWTESLVESRRHLTPYSGKIAGAFARLETQKIQHGFATAGATGTSTVKLVDAFRELNDAVQPALRDGITILNTLGTGMAKFGTTLANIYTLLRSLPPFKEIAEVLDKIEENTKKELEEQKKLNRLPAMEHLIHLQGPAFRVGGRRPPLPPL